ncbi:unnamed protein product, partial [Haemonchus placei]|uniref:DNA_mis_repair domain-containing protein n=1 Tax=Haemonchus placei TaxID=6290 RepID=A0A0N4W6K5_HAEPC
GCAVRQLIDNSLDASAHSIEIRARNNGYESVEIIDDGTGIESDNFDFLCKPHSTSKLSGLNDFGHLSTLGFRGEALNALCALASITVITRHRSDHLGTKLRFDHSGNIIESVSAARSVGATVIVENLFETLPVRRKEFERTSKKEFSKVLATVQSFALSRPDIKFVCNNTVAGKRQQLICTPGNATIRDVSHCSTALGPILFVLFIEVYSVFSQLLKALYIRINGFVSSCEHGFGRSAADRQFVYVNQRPVDYAKICRVVNDVYQQYNRSQYPTLVLNIEVPPGMVDVNVTPDKRMVFFEREKELLALIRSSMLATFHPLLGAYTSVEDSRSKGDEAHFTMTLDAFAFKPISRENSSSAEIAQSSSSYIVKPESSKKPPIVATCTKDSATKKKSDFNQMSVIGQFNKGFIITRLRNHLFLIDQHASDEKFNFERFQKKARVETQRLIQPQLLDIGAVQASVLKDNLNILEANGFGFEFKDGDGCTVPLLVSTPVLHSWQFDKSDIEEILTVVSEFPGVMYRPAKLRRIFASRACRKSVMIGTTLTTAQMQTIVRQLSTLDQPWNCPHGRPTLRHLVDLQNMNTT